MGPMVMYLGDEVLGTLRYPLGVVDVYADDALVGSRLAVRLERRRPHQELVAEHPEAPLVHAHCVRLSIDHLGAQIVQGAAHGLAQFRRGVHGPPKICQLQCPIRGHQDILRFEISVDHIVLVAIF